MSVTSITSNQNYIYASEYTINIIRLESQLEAEMEKSKKVAEEVEQLRQELAVVRALPETVNGDTFEGATATQN